MLLSRDKFIFEVLWKKLYRGQGFRQDRHKGCVGGGGGIVGANTLPPPKKKHWLKGFYNSILVCIIALAPRLMILGDLEA